jgi:hypothetical protein
VQEAMNGKTLKFQWQRQFMRTHMVWHGVVAIET